MPSGQRFSVGTGFSDAERHNPPAVGSVITFRYQELTDGGVPRFPVYISIRRDEPEDAQPPAPPSARIKPRSKRK
jgi:DNA ligase-1